MFVHDLQPLSSQIEEVVVGGYSWSGSHLKVSSVIKQLNLTCDTKNVLALNLAWLYSPTPVNLSIGRACLALGVVCANFMTAGSKDKNLVRICISDR